MLLEQHDRQYDVIEQFVCTVRCENGVLPFLWPTSDPTTRRPIGCLAWNECKLAKSLNCAVSFGKRGMNAWGGTREYMSNALQASAPQRLFVLILYPRSKHTCSPSVAMQRSSNEAAALWKASRPRGNSCQEHYVPHAAPKFPRYAPRRRAHW